MRVRAMKAEGKRAYIDTRKAGLKERLHLPEMTFLHGTLTTQEYSELHLRRQGQFT